MKTKPNVEKRLAAIEGRLGAKPKGFLRLIVRWLDGLGREYKPQTENVGPPPADQPEKQETVIVNFTRTITDKKPEGFN
jgi:hypothetical protein